MEDNKVQLNKVISPSECIRRELINYMKKIDLLGKEAPQILIFPANLGPILTQNICYQANLFNLAAVCINDRDIQVVAVGRKQYLRELSEQVAESKEPSNKKISYMKSQYNRQTVTNPNVNVSNQTNWSLEPHIEFNTESSEISLITNCAQQVNGAASVLVNKNDMLKSQEDHIIELASNKSSAVKISQAVVPYSPICTMIQDLLKNLPIINPIQPPVTVSLIPSHGESDLGISLRIQYNDTHGEVATQTIIMTSVSNYMSSNNLNHNNSKYGPAKNAHLGSITYPNGTLENSTEYINIQQSSTFNTSGYPEPNTSVHPIPSELVDNKTEPDSNLTKSTNEQQIKCYKTVSTQTDNELSHFGEAVVPYVTTRDEQQYRKQLCQKLGHIIEIYDFPTRFTTSTFLNLYKAEPRYIKWCDNEHVLLVTSSAAHAKRALRMKFKFLKSRPIEQASTLSIEMACSFLPAGKIQTMMWSRKRFKPENSAQSEN